jgi:hypothetical protein
MTIAVLKAFVSPTSPTSGLGGYALEGASRASLRARRRKKKGEPKLRIIAIATKAAVDAKAHEAATSPFNLTPAPTDAQISAGVYRKGHLRFGKIGVAIENPAGSSRRPEWSPLTAHYGYAKNSEGADGDEVDAFVRVGISEDYAGPVFVVDQVNADGSFDEHKALIGWETEDAARRAYLSNYETGWTGLGEISQIDLEQFGSWLRSGDTKMPIAAQIPFTF